ncbi:hypothetical protein [Streptomyces peucetius]|uniref:Uncharacterized protein n=1 Tax=Streptomyces peucetius TaxID=1950 RepID=A0ABY6I8P9_STRPE|nr:hypothetical protein [Streptomyces peucetius]UYQ63380.1 hypothetical protein OGH68_19195 [Streptomyces peucetius]
MTTDLSTLTTAAKKWDDMAKEFFDHVEQRYKDDVQDRPGRSRQGQ